MEIVIQIISVVFGIGLAIVAVCIGIMLILALIACICYVLDISWRFSTHKTTLFVIGRSVEFLWGIAKFLLRFLWGILTKILGVAGSVTKGVSIFGGGLIEKGIDSYTHLQAIKLQHAPQSDKERREEKSNMIKKVYGAWQKAKQGNFEELVIVYTEYGNEALSLIKDLEKMSEIQARSMIEIKELI